MDLKIPPINIAAIAGQVASPPRSGESNGINFTEFVLVNNKLFRTKDKSMREKSTFIPVITWGKLAEDCLQSLTTQSPVYVVGELETPYDTKRGRCGKPRIRASEVQFLERASVGGRPGMSAVTRGSEALEVDGPGEG